MKLFIITTLTLIALSGCNGASVTDDINNFADKATEQH